MLDLLHFPLSEPSCVRNPRAHSPLSLAGDLHANRRALATLVCACRIAVIHPPPPFFPSTSAAYSHREAEPSLSPRLTTASTASAAKTAFHHASLTAQGQASTRCCAPARSTTFTTQPEIATWLLFTAAPPSIDADCAVACTQSSGSLATSRLAELAGLASSVLPGELRRNHSPASGQLPSLP